jgi:hypothetical protein
MANNPLTDRDLESIDANLAQLAEAEDQIKLAEQAGMDLSQQREQVRTQRAQLQKIKQTYFPGR